MGELITQKAYAEQRGVKKQYINKLVKQGRIVLVAGKIDPAAADLAIKQTARRPAKSKITASAPAVPLTGEHLMAAFGAAAHESITLTEAQTRKTLADAERAEIKLGRERLEVAAIADVEHVTGAHYSSIRALFLAMPAKVAIKAANKTAAEVRAILATEVRKILDELRSPLGMIP